MSALQYTVRIESATMTVDNVKYILTFSTPFSSFENVPPPFLLTTDFVVKVIVVMVSQRRSPGNRVDRVRKTLVDYIPLFRGYI